MQNVFRILLLLLFSNGMFGQCYPLSTGATTITGSYTADINPPFGSIIYITSTATVTGNIYLNNSSLLNCGTILSRKVVMKQNVNNHMHGIQNSNLMICDSVILDSLGHLHNNDSLICRFFQMGYSASADNYYFMEAKTSSIEEGSWFSSLASFKADYFSLKGNDTRYLLINGRNEIKKLLKVDSLSTIHGSGHFCIDSCLLNRGTISLGNTTTTKSFINVSGLSQNYGIMWGFDFCDRTSANGGEPDTNTGILNNITFCETVSNACFYSTEIIDKDRVIKVGIYPNPTANELFIIDNDKYDLENARLDIYNSLGQIVFSDKFNSKINVADLSQGFYSLRIRQRSGDILYSNFVKE